MKLSRWLQRLTGRGLSGREQKTKRLRRDLIAELSVTRLETRRVLSADGVTSELVIDAGEDAGDGKADSFQIEINQDRVEVTVNGELVRSESLDHIESIRIEGSSDNDLIEADFKNALSNGLELTIHAAGGDDSVRIVSQEHIDSLIHSISGSGAGESELRIAQNISSITYSGVERIDHELSIDAFAIQWDIGNQDVTVSNDPREGWTAVEIVSSGESSNDPASTTFAFLNPSHELRLFDGSNDDADQDQVTIQGVDNAFDADFLFRGDESDSVIVSGDLDVGGGDIDLVAGNLSIDGTVATRGGNVLIDSGSGGTTIVSGTIDVSDSRAQHVGGSVHVLGTHVGLIGNAFIDASGDAGGGVILIGGDYQGGNPLIDNAARTLVGENVVLAADAIRTGDGGKVIVWADEWTRFAGTINARGGILGGNGGFAEVSGKQSLDFRGSVDLTAAKGASGSLLLDPANLIISDADGTDNGSLADDSVLFLEGGAVDFHITPASFENLNANVTLQATTDITVVNDIAFAGTSHTLALQAGNDLTINASITSPDGANHFIFEADSIHQPGGANGTGTLTIANVSIQSSGGDISLIAADFAMTSLDPGDINAGAGNISIVQTNGNVDPTIGDTMTLASGALTTGELTNFASTGTLTIGQATTAGGTIITAQAIDQSSSAVEIVSTIAGEVAFVSNDGFTMDRDVTTHQTTRIDADFNDDGVGNVTLGNNDDLVTTNSALTITANDIIINTSSGTINSGTATTTIIESHGDGIVLGGAVATTELAITAAELARITANGLTLETTDSIVVDGISAASSNSISGTTTLTANGSSSSVSFLANASTFNTLTVNSSDGITINANLTTDVGGITVNADTGVADNDGTFTIASGVAVTTTNNVLDITANALSLIGTANSGNGETIIRDSDGTGIGFGVTSVTDGLNVSDADLDQITSTGLTLITAGNITADTISQPGNVSGTVILTADGASSVVDFNGGASSFDALVVNANEGVSVNSDVSTTGGITVNADTDADDNSGTFAVSTGFSVNSAGNVIVITANDVDLAGSLDSGVSSTTITDSDGTGINLSATALTNGITISGSELQNISATGLTVSTAGAITVDNVTATNSDNVSGTTTLVAATEVTFSGTESTFNALDVRADDRITLSVNVTTDTGNLSFDADFNNTTDTNDRLDFAAGILLSSAGSMTLDATTGGIHAAGALTLNAADGITVNDSLTTAGQLNINADTGVADNIGTLTIASGAAVTTTNSLLDITANDLSLTGTVNTGTGATIIRDSDGTGIGFGATPVANGLNISDADLDQITSTGLTLVTTGNITVDAISQPGSVSGAITLTADGASSTINFITAASSFDTLVVDANEGVTVSSDLSTAGGGITINADKDANDDVGTFTVSTGVSVISADNTIAITANDLDLAGTLDSGASSTTINDSDGTGINLSATTITDGITITGAELQNISATGLTVNTAGSITVDNITAANSDNLSGTTTLAAGTEISFSGTESTFNALDVRANDRITVSVNVTTDTGNLSIDGNANHSADTNDDVQIADGVILASAGLLTLDATSGGIHGAGVLTLNAVDGVTVNDSLTTAGTLNIDTDTGASGGNRRLTISTGASVSTSNNLLNVTANEISLDGTINTGSAATSIRDSDGTGIGFGDTTILGGLNISDADLDKITSIGLTLATVGNITVDNISQPAGVTGAITLVADGPTSTVNFSNNASSFDTLIVNANEGVSVNVDLSTTAGGITVNADLDADDNSGTLAVTGAVSSAGNTISITANDVDISGTINSGVAATTITDSDGTGIGLGDTPVVNGVNLVGSELQNITATGLTLTTAGAITVNNILATNSDNIGGTTTLVASTEVLFSGTESTFNALDARANDRITVTVNVTTDVGGMSLDGDADNTIGTNDDLQFAAAIQ
ncbi:MAG: S-layer family protein, partial [Planctomycetales bacterium]|nr:S-layer family protein [Planctomycetales bacterium]